MGRKRGREGAREREEERKRDRERERERAIESEGRRVPLTFAGLCVVEDGCCKQSGVQRSPREAGHRNPKRVV